MSELSTLSFMLQVENAIKELIRVHQKTPGNILRALVERVYTPAHCKVS